MCGKDGRFAQTGHCGSDEICIGPSNASFAVHSYENPAFCTKGRLKLKWIADDVI